MLKFETQSGTGTVENSWKELSPVQFIEAVALTNEFVAGAFTDIDEYRLRMLEMLTGYKRKHKKNKHAEQINENLYLISEQLNFAVLPDVGPEEVLEFFSPELRELLKTRFPWEIHEPEHQSQILMVKNMIRVNFKVNFNLECNPLPYILKGEKIYAGPVFSTENGDIETNLKAGNYLDAAEYFNAYSETKTEKYLDRFIDCLYQPEHPSTPLRMTQRTNDSSPLQREIPIHRERVSIPDASEQKTRDAIIMLFIYIQQTFSTDPVYSILFSQPGQSISEKLSLGSDEAIGQLVEAGYGNHNEVSDLDIRTFFNYQVRLIRKNVEQLRSMKKTTAEIAKLLNLSVENAQKL